MSTAEALLEVAHAIELLWGAAIVYGAFYLVVGPLWRKE